MEKEKEVLKTKICKICGVKKELSGFNKNKSFKDGYQSRCKVCIYQGRFIHGNYDIKSEYDIQDNFRLRNPTKEDYRKMWILLQNMGYDIHSPISSQFESRYGFEKTNFNINKDNITYFSPKECGLT